MRSCKLGFLALLLCITGSLQAAAQDQSLEFQLVGAVPKNNGCSIIIRTTNMLSMDLDKIALEIYIISTTDTFLGFNQFNFPATPSDRFKYAQFTLDKIECGSIGHLDVNSFVECAGKKDYRQMCSDKAQFSSKLKIGFINRPQN